MEEIIDKWGHLPYWGVVSTFAVDTFYDDLNYYEAVAKAKEETKEPGRDAIVVFVVRKFDGPSLTKNST